MTQDIESQWGTITKTLLDTSEEVLGRKRKQMKDWMSTETWTKTEERKALKQKLNVAKTTSNCQAQEEYEKNREIKNNFRKDKRKLVEELATKVENAAKIGT
jgi:hypothetical protein